MMPNEEHETTREPWRDDPMGSGRIFRIDENDVMIQANAQDLNDLEARANPLPALDARDALRRAATDLREEVEDEWESDSCPNCEGEGWIMICPDDMCRGMQECVHTDGYRICRACRGTGYVRATALTPHPTGDAPGREKEAGG